MKLIKYVAAVTTHDARVRMANGISTGSLDPLVAKGEADRLTRDDHCEPQCVYRVYEITTEILQWRG